MLSLFSGFVELVFELGPSWTLGLRSVEVRQVDRLFDAAAGRVAAVAAAVLECLQARLALVDREDGDEPNLRVRATMGFPCVVVTQRLVI